MTTGKLLDLLQADAREYRTKALERLIRNGQRMYGLSEADMRELRKDGGRARWQRIIDATLADFINEVALARGGDRGERVEHLR